MSLYCCLLGMIVVPKSCVEKKISCLGKSSFGRSCWLGLDIKEKDPVLSSQTGSRAEIETFKKRRLFSTKKILITVRKAVFGLIYLMTGTLKANKAIFNVIRNIWIFPAVTKPKNVCCEKGKTCLCWKNFCESRTSQYALGFIISYP